jgi:RNA polymerase sigma factor (sigma-70 family)
MPAMTDAELLREYARSKSDAAFAELVARHGSLVRAAALRQVRDGHLADDVSQAVFIVLAKRAASVSAEHLSGWLLLTTRYCAKDALRKQSRRAHHEHEAAAMTPTILPDTSVAREAQDQEIAGHLDEAITRLRPRESTAVALRFLQDQPLAAVAQTLGISVDAAQKVIARSLPKLRKWLARRGVMLSSTAGLTDAMVRIAREMGNVSLPGGPIVPPAAASVQSISIAKGAMTMMRFTTLKTASLVAAAVIVLAAGTGVVVKQATAAGPAHAPADATAAEAPQPAPVAPTPTAASGAADAKNLVGFNSPFLELVGCRIKQKVELTISASPPAAQADQPPIVFLEQQYGQVQWTVDASLADRASGGFVVSVSPDADPASATSTKLDRSARVLNDAGPNEPGDYTVKVTAVAAGATDAAAPVAQAIAHVRVKPLPNVQICINDIQPDLSLRGTTVVQGLNESAQAIQSGGFINSDFVHLDHMFDDAGEPVQFTATHQGNIYRYRYKLHRPIEPGQPLMTATTGTETGLIKRVPNTNFCFYSMDHTPGGNMVTRRIELYRLPEGATVVSTTPEDLPHKVVDGREQVFVDTMIPEGGHNLTAFRYRMKGQ